MLTVVELRSLIENLPDDTPVLVPAPDHNYRNCDAFYTTVLESDRQFMEDSGEDDAEEVYKAKRVNAFIIT